MVMLAFMLSKDTLKTFNIWLMLVEETLRKFIATLYDMLHEVSSKLF